MQSLTHHPLREPLPSSCSAAGETDSEKSVALPRFIRLLVSNYQVTCSSPGTQRSSGNIKSHMTDRVPAVMELKA